MSIASRPVQGFRCQPVLPGDKSVTHRAWLLAAMASGPSRIVDPNRGSDCEATLQAVRSLGVDVDDGGDSVSLEGRLGVLSRPAHPLDLGNSGTGFRMLLGVLAGQPFPVEMAGDSSLNRRPMERILEPLRTMGATASSVEGYPPVNITGGALRGIAYRLPVPSAQVKSALLLAGIQAEGQTTVQGGETSRDHTERMLAGFGATVEGSGNEISVTGPQGLTGQEVLIPRDVSAAIFYLAAAAACPGSVVTLEEVGLNPSRTKALEVLKQMGMQLITTPSDNPNLEPTGSLVASTQGLRAIRIEPEDVPALIDELPALAIAAAFATGVTEVRGAGELRVKESNRLEAVLLGLRAIGVPVEPLEDGWSIQGSGAKPIPGGVVESRGDHRIAMAFLVAGLGSKKGVRIMDEPLIESSDPFFKENLEQIMENAR